MSYQTRVYGKAPLEKSSQPVSHKGLLQHSATRTEKPSAIPPIVHEVLNSPGQPLDASTRAFMEPRFGHDFSRVRVHTDSRAAESAREVNANAYTMGHHLVFGTDMYAPHTAHGQSLLAHELTHVVQTNRHQSPIGESIAPENHPSEQEAELAAGGVSYQVTATPGGVMQRQVALLEKMASIDLAELKATGELVTSFLDAARNSIPPEYFKQLQKELSEPKNQASFNLGEVAGIVAGAAKDIWGSFRGLIELVVKTSSYYQAYSLIHKGWKDYFQEKKQDFENILSLMSALYEFVKAVVKDPNVLVTIAHELGEELGKRASKWFTNDFMPSSSFSKGETIGEVIGTILIEIALLFIGPEELAIRGGAIAAKASERTRLGRVILEAMEKIPLLKNLLEGRKLAGAGREGLNLAEKGAVSVEEAAHTPLAIENKRTHAAPAVEQKATAAEQHVYSTDHQANANVVKQKTIGQEKKLLKKPPLETDLEASEEIERSFEKTFDQTLTQGPPSEPSIPPKPMSLSQVKAAKQILGKKLDEIPALKRLWEKTAKPITLTKKNSRSVFDNHLDRFWRAVRKDPEAIKVFEDAGFEIPKSSRPVTAPVHKEVSGKHGRISLDHIERRASDYELADDPSNLRIVVQGDNTLLENIQQKRQKYLRETGRGKDDFK